MKGKIEHLEKKENKFQTLIHELESKNRALNKKLLHSKSNNESNAGFSTDAIDNLFDDFQQLKTGGNLITHSIPSQSLISKHKNDLEEKDKIINDIKCELVEKEQ